MGDVKRDKSGRFVPGHKGYTRQTHKYKLLRKMCRENEPAILERVLEMALGGEPTALKFLLHKLYGSQPLSNFRIKGKDPLAASANILGAIGSEDPALLRAASQALVDHVKILELTELEQRIKKLEEVKE